MEIRNLNTFLQVSLMQNFTKAADVLGYTQSNVSSQIRQLETEIGAPLFNRVGKNVTLTQYGQMLVPYAQQIVSTSAQIETLLLNKDKIGGTVRVGFCESLFECLLEETFFQYHKQFPNVVIDVTVDATAKLFKKVHTNEIDAACLIADYSGDSDLCFWNTEPCKMVVVATPSHPIAASETLSLQNLDGQEFILMEDTAPYILNFISLLYKNNVEITSFLRVQSPEAAIKVMQRGNYLSVLPDYAVNKAISEGKLVRIDIPDFNQTQSVQFITHKNKAVTPQISDFLTCAYNTFLSYTQDNILE
ncbi:MAG: LysR family transcriptional regulator [Oscillospiraceae bacterium]|nr:LysR family transcriptional regulator [Oscillospiraceae bacterium]